MMRIITISIVSMLLAGCTGGTTTAGIELAQEECAKHGGLSYIKGELLMGTSDFPIVRCNDGLMLQLRDIADKRRYDASVSRYNDIHKQ